MARPSRTIGIPDGERCGGGTGRARDHSFLATPVMAAVVALTLASCSSSSSPSTTSINPATARTQITIAYRSFFDLSHSSIQAKADVVQGGATIKSDIAAILQSSLAKDAGGARVLSVVLYSKSECTNQALLYPCALVGYDILSPTGSVLQGPGKGYAVFSAGKWLVAKSTACGLFRDFNAFETGSHKLTITGCAGV